MGYPPLFFVVMFLAKSGSVVGLAKSKRQSNPTILVLQSSLKRLPSAPSSRSFDGLGKRARHQVDNCSAGLPLQHQMLVAGLGEALVQRLEVNPKPPQTFLEILNEVEAVNSYVHVLLFLPPRSTLPSKSLWTSMTSSL
nr:hypothetical protein Iba_scaffold2471.2CG0100 [Ipomoea batatas]